MGNVAKGEGGSAPIVSADEVRRLAGAVNDHTIAAVLELGPTAHELEVAVIFARGEGDRVDRLGHELAGQAALIHEILLGDELYQENDR